jgi:hypothetical protein
MVKLGNAKAQGSFSIAGNLLLSIVIASLFAAVVLAVLLF